MSYLGSKDLSKSSSTHANLVPRGMKFLSSKMATLGGGRNSMYQRIPSKSMITEEPLSACKNSFDDFSIYNFWISNLM